MGPPELYYTILALVGFAKIPGPVLKICATLPHLQISRRTPRCMRPHKMAEIWIYRDKCSFAKRRAADQSKVWLFFKA